MTTSTSASPTLSSGGVPAPGELSGDDAARIVQERMGGTVHEVELTARDGVTYDVRVDAATGDFTRVDQDDRDDDRGGDDDDDRYDDHGDD